jgi:hypothetical protein
MKENLTGKNNFAYPIKGMEVGEGGPKGGHNQRPQGAHNRHEQGPGKPKSEEPRLDNSQARPESEAPKKEESAEERLLSDVTAEDMFTHDVSEIANEKSREFATKFRDLVSKKPIKEWSAEELKDWYEKLGEVRSSMPERSSNLDLLESEGRLLMQGLYEKGEQDWIVEKSLEGAQEEARLGRRHEGVGTMAAGAGGEGDGGEPPAVGGGEAGPGEPEEGEPGGEPPPIDEAEELNALRQRIEDPLLRSLIDRIGIARRMGNLNGFFEEIGKEANETMRRKIEERDGLLQQANPPQDRIARLNGEIASIGEQRMAIDLYIARLQMRDQAALARQREITPRKELEEKLSRGERLTPKEDKDYIYHLLNDGDGITPEQRAVMNGEIDAIDIAAGTLDRLDAVNLEIIVRDELFLEKYMNKIISRPEGDPLRPYRLGWYESINLEQLLNKVKEYDAQRVKDGKLPAEASLNRFLSLSNESAMRERFHEMRRYMLEANLRDFAQIARTIAPEYLQKAADYTGVGTAHRLYDTLYKEFMARKQVIEPKDFKEIERQVAKRFREASRAKLIGPIINQQTGERRELEDWEINRALFVGYNFSTIKLRIPELVSVGRIPSIGNTPSIPETFMSFELESMTRALNPIRWLGSRFGMGGVRGGQWLLEQFLHAKDKAIASRSKFEKVYGLSRSTYERSSPFGQTSFDSGWRPTEAYFNTFKITVPVRKVTLRDSLENEAYEIKVFDPSSNVTEEIMAGHYMNWQNKYAGMDSRFDRTAALRPLVEQMPFYRGLLATQGIDNGTKAELWKLIARDMPNQIMLIMSGNADYEALKGRYFPGEDQTAFNNLINKLSLYQERRLQDQIEAAPKDGDGFRRADRQISLDLNREIPGFRFTDAEKAFLKGLVGMDLEGKTTGTDGLAKSRLDDLVNTRWPINPIIEDAAFETADYMRTGTEVFRRRIGSDFIAVHEAGSEALAVLQQPNMKFETFVEHMGKLVTALDTPFGLKDAQDYAYPMIKARLEYTHEFRNGRLIPGAHEILSFFGIPLSMAQRFHGRHAEAFDANGTRNEIEHLVAAGVTRRHKEPGETKAQNEVLKEDAKATLFDVFRERLPIGILYLLIIVLSQISRGALKER